MFVKRLNHLVLIMGMISGVPGDIAPDDYFHCLEHNSQYYYHEYDQKSVTFRNVMLHPTTPYSLTCDHDASIVGASFEVSSMEEVPKKLFDTFNALEEVNLANCHIKHVSRYSLENAGHLLSLNLSTNSIEKLDNFSFAGARRLKILDLSNNSISVIANNTFDSLRDLVSLHLNGNKLQTLDSGVFRDLSRLENVFLFDNALEMLEESLFANNTQLKKIFLQNNQIRTIAERTFVFEFVEGSNSLDVLALSDNLLSKLNLRSIRVKNVLVYNNQLEEIYISSEVLSLVAEHNRISSILGDNSSDNMAIKELHLRNNCITSLDQLNQFKSLEVLDLSYNYIGPLSVGSFAKLSNLLTLNLQKTGISNLQHGTFAHQAGLTVLDISYNNLCKIDVDILVSSGRLTTLYLNGNRLTSIDYGHMKTMFPQLTTIGVADNNWNCSFLAKLVRFCTAERITLRQEEASADESSLNQTNVAGINCYDGPESWRNGNTPLQHIEQHFRTITISSDDAALHALLQDILDEVKRIEERHGNATEKQGKLKETMSELSERQLSLAKDVFELHHSLLDISLSLLSNRTNNFSAVGEDLRRTVEGMNNLTLARLKLTEDRLVFQNVEQSFKVSSALALGKENEYKLTVLSKRVEQWISSRDKDFIAHPSAYKLQQSDSQNGGGSTLVVAILLAIICLLMGVVIFVLLKANRASFTMGYRGPQRTKDSMSTIVEEEV